MRVTQMDAAPLKDSCKYSELSNLLGLRLEPVRNVLPGQDRPLCAETSLLSCGMELGWLLGAQWREVPMELLSGNQCSWALASLCSSLPWLLLHLLDNPLLYTPSRSADLLIQSRAYLSVWLRLAYSLLEACLAFGLGMAPTLAPVTASSVSAVPRHVLEMKQSFLPCQQCEYGCPIPLQANCPPDRMMNIYMGSCRRAPRQEKFEIFNLGLKTGDSLKIKGKISNDADEFSINLGSKSSDLAFHFNPRFNESVIVCNSRCSNAWEAEHRDNHLCFSRGSSIKMTIEMLEDKFQVKLPDGHEVHFPNRHCYSKISYMSVKGGFRVTSFKLD